MLIASFIISFFFGLFLKYSINKGISNFNEIFNKDLTEYYSYYQKHLIIFVNDINIIKKPINKTYFIKKGIQVILFAKINKKSDENELIKKFGDEFNRSNGNV